MPGKFPEKGTPEYEVRMEAIRRGVVAREARKKSAADAQTQAPGSGDDVFDLGEPERARMASDAVAEPKKKGRARAASKSKITQAEVHLHIKRPLDLISRFPGHEHWQREEDEIDQIAEPATRILNRHPAIIDALQTVGDPVALIVACVMILGPSVAEEIRNARHRAGGERRQPVYQQPEQRYQEPAHEGIGGNGFVPSAGTATDGAAPTPPVEGVPVQQF